MLLVWHENNWLDREAPFTYLFSTGHDELITMGACNWRVNELKKKRVRVQGYILSGWNK
jgi:hypothetical protein